VGDIMFKRIFDRHKLEITIISCGDAGQDIGAEIIDTLKERGAAVKSLAISSNLVPHSQAKKFQNRINIGDNQDGFAKKLEDAIEVMNTKRDVLRKEIKSVLSSEQEGLLLITTGAGATGLGGTIVVLDILYKEFKRIPPVLTVLPESFENSRVQYNTAMFLYDIIFKSTARGNAVILLDNNPTVKEYQLPFSQVSRKRIETIPIAIADLLYASFEPSISDEFTAEVTDLLESLHTPGISVFVAEDLSNDSGEDSSRIQDVLSDSVIEMTSLPRDEIFTAKNAFITIFNIEKSEDKLSLQTEFEARKLFREFHENRPYVKFVNEDNNAMIKLRAVIAGLPLPTRIIQIMKIARDSRKKVISDEYSLSNEIINLDVERINELNSNLVAIFK